MTEQRRMVQWGAALAVSLAAAGAHAASASLSLPWYQQTQSNWCAIASAEMLLAFYGSSVQQCEMANYDFGRSDCCSNPSSSSCNPSSGSFTGKPAGYYGLSYSQWKDNSFSFSQFKSEIDAGRPVSIGWNWNSGGGHAMNVAGYNIVQGPLFSTYYLEVWDPQPGAGCPGGEDTCWMTYASYFGGASPTYNHTAQAPLYNIKWSPVCNSDYFDLPGGSMQQCFDTWTHRNRSPQALTSTMSNGNLVYSGSYQPATGAGWYQYTGMSVSDYQTKFNTLASQNYRPAEVSLTAAPWGWVVNAIWQPAEGAFSSYTGMSQATFNSNHSWFTSNGYVIVDLFATSDSSNTPSFAATWVKTTSQGQFPIIGITASNYQTVFNQQTAAGRRLLRVSAYNNAGTIEYATIWANGNGIGFWSDNGWSEPSFANDDGVHTGQGMKLKYVSAFNDSYNGIWTN
jgi:peptidase C39-like protein/polyglycine hydrolase-like protein